MQPLTIRTFLWCAALEILATLNLYGMGLDTPRKEV